MVDQDNREPIAAAITISFFCLGQAINWLGDPQHVQLVKDWLAILSFVVSIAVGIKTLLHKFNKRKQP